MTENLLNKYKGGFVVYHDSDTQKMFPDEWLLNKKNSNKEQLCFQAYDANLMPLPNIKDWSKDAIKEMTKKISLMFEDVPVNIYLDGHLLDTKKQKLIIKK